MSGASGGKAARAHVIRAAEAASRAGEVGGKAASLARLVAEGVPVPPFFCVGSGAFEAFLARRRAALEPVLSALAATAEADLPALAARARAALEPTEVDPELAGAIRAEVAALAAAGGDSGAAAAEAPGSFAVRSSALREDAPERSFAGLFDTFLHVPAADVPGAVGRCWLSAMSPRLLAYCVRRGLDPADARLAVVVQRMVRSRAAGVLFTANPTGPLGEVVVVAGYGLGEGIVASQVETDTYVYDRASKAWRAEVALKTAAVDLDDEAAAGGTRRRPVPEALAAAPVLDEAALRTLLDLGLAIEASRGHVQDIEWCVDPAGRVLVLQARPITSIPAGRRTIFDGNNITESYPGLCLPLTYSILRRGYEENLRRTARRIGIRPARIAENRRVFEHLVGHIEGRAYYNLSHWYALLRLVPVAGGSLVPAFEEMVGVRERRAGERASGAASRLREALDLGRLVAGIAWRFATIGPAMRAYKARFDACARGHAATDLSALTPHEVIDHFHDLFDEVMRIVNAALVNDLLLMLSVRGAKGLLERLGFPEPTATFNGLMVGEEGMESVEPVRSAVRMAEALRRAPGLAARIRAALERPDPRAALLAALGGSDAAAFRAAFEAHLDRYGDRGPEELKLEVPSFRERPEALAALVLTLADSALEEQAMRRGERAIRDEAEAEVGRRLAGRPLRRALLGLALRATRRLLRNRESARLDRARVAGMGRRIFGALGEKLAAEGALEAPADVHYATVEELTGAIYGSGIGPGLKRLVAERRALFDGYRAKDPADRIVCQGTVLRNFIPQRRPAATLAAGDGAAGVLAGTPCSPGEVEAEAVVVEDAAAAPDVGGKVIVAPMTDPGWVFLMIRAAGLVVEHGSLLSHTAIIGRELGIPTIVGVKDAARRIPTGTRVRLDGGRGTVALVGGGPGR